ncbi:hypothetical protein [Sphingomonas oryzagri]
MGDGIERMRIVCAWCGSADVARDAWASWDVGKQDWVLVAVFDDGFCHACECERSLEERIGGSPGEGVD